MSEFRSEEEVLSYFEQQTFVESQTLFVYLNNVRDKLIGIRDSTITEQNFSIEDVRSDIEIITNGYMSDAGNEFSESTFYEDDVSTQLSGSNISNDDYLQFFEDVILIVKGRYDNLNETNKSILTVSLKYKGTDNGVVQYKLKTTFGYSLMTSAIPDCYTMVFNPSDNAKFFYNSSLCTNSPSFGKEIRDKFNSRHALPTTKRSIFGNIEDLFIDPIFSASEYDFINYNDAVSGDGYRDYLMFSATSDNGPSVFCYDDLELDWYYCNFIDVVDAFSTIIGPTYYFVVVPEINEYRYGISTSGYVYVEEANVSYGQYIDLSSQSASPGLAPHNPLTMLNSLL